MLSNTVLQVLFSCVHGFGPEKYLSTLDLRKWHNNPNIFSISKYGNFLQHVLRSGMHLVCVHNLLGVIWLSFKWKQGVLILSAATSTCTYTIEYRRFGHFFWMQQAAREKWMYCHLWWEPGLEKASKYSYSPLNTYPMHSIQQMCSNGALWCPNAAPISCSGECTATWLDQAQKEVWSVIWRQ